MFLSLLSDGANLGHYSGSTLSSHLQLRAGCSSFQLLAYSTPSLLLDLAAAGLLRHCLVLSSHCPHMLRQEFLPANLSCMLPSTPAHECSNARRVYVMMDTSASSLQIAMVLVFG